MFKALFSTSEKYKDIGLLILRVVVGMNMLVLHGFDKITGGPEVWTKVGNNIAVLGIDFLPVVWGFLAGFAEFFCSALLVLGILHRPATVMLAFTMLVAVMMHFGSPAGTSGAGWSGAAHALELLAVYVGLFLMGPGKYRIKKW